MIFFVKNWSCTLAEIITAKELDQELIATEVDENLKEELDAEFEEAFNSF